MAILHVLSYNVRINVASDGPFAWPNRYHRIGAFLSKASMDVFGLQEPNETMLGDLSSYLEAYQIEGSPRQAGGELTPLFFRKDRFKRLSSKTIWLSDTPTVESRYPDSHFFRIATILVVQDPAGRKLRFCNTHLDYASVSVQERQMNVLLRELEDDLEIPTILMGDFNQTPNGPLQQQLVANGFTPTYAETDLCTPTFHGFHPSSVGEPIDYIFLRQCVKMEPLIIHNEAEMWKASDHYPIQISIQY